MSLARFAFYALWIAPALLMALLAAVMKHRHLHRQLPAFFAYAVFTAARTPILFFVFQRHYDLYSPFYWTAEAVSAALGFASIHEVFRHLFQDHEATQRLGVLLFRWTGGVFVLLAVVAGAATDQPDASRLSAAVLVVVQSVRLAQCGLLFFLFAFSYYFGFTWRNHQFGIALGFGLFAGVQLAAVAMRAQLGMVNQETWVWVSMASYNCAVLVWVTYLLAPRPAEVTVPAPQLAEVKSWNQALLQLLLR